MPSADYRIDKEFHVYLSPFAQSTEQHDLTETVEFQELLRSALEIGLEVNQVPHLTSKNTVVNGMRLHLLRWFSKTVKHNGPIVVLLHGGHQSCHSWDLVALGLSMSWSVLAPDLRGHGDSEWARDSDYSVERVVEDVQELLKAESVTSCVLIGHGMSTTIAWAVASLEDSPVKGVILIGELPFELSPGDTSAVTSIIHANWEFESLEEYVAFVRKVSPGRSEDTVRKTLGFNLLVRSDGKFARKHDGRWWDTRRRADTEPQLESGLGVPECPVLLLRGQNSVILSASEAEAFVSRNSNVSFQEVSSSYHSVHTENPVETVRLLETFISGLASGHGHSLL